MRLNVLVCVSVLYNSLVYTTVHLIEKRRYSLLNNGKCTVNKRYNLTQVHTKYK